MSTRYPRRIFVLAAIAALTSLLATHTVTGTALGSEKTLRLTLSVTNPDTGQPIRSGSTIPATTPFQVTASTNSIDCAGQIVITALGAPGFLPSVLVSSSTMIIGPAAATDAATTERLEAGALPRSAVNDFKISASCNGSRTRQFADADYEFYVAPLP